MGTEHRAVYSPVNQDGKRSEFPIKVRVTERIRWDSVYMVHGFGHQEKKLRRCYGKGASDTNLITKVLVDPVNGRHRHARQLCDLYH